MKEESNLVEKQAKRVNISTKVASTSLEHNALNAAPSYQ